MAAPTGSEGQLGWGFSTGLTTHGEAIRSGPVTNFMRFKSASGFVAKRTLLMNENMDPSNQTIRGIKGQAAISPKITLNPDVNSIPKLLVHHCSKDATITTPSGGTNSRQWVIGPYETGDTAPASHVDSLFFEFSDGDGYPVLVDGARLQDLGIKVSAGTVTQLELGFLACTDTYLADAEELLVGAGAYAGVPQMRGHVDSSITSAIKVKVTDAATRTVKFTTDAYAGSTTVVIPADKWVRVQLDDGSYADNGRKDPLEFLLPTGSGALTTNDEWSFDLQRTAATASYSTLDPLEAASLEFTVGGETYYVKSADIKITRPRKANFVSGRNYALNVQKNGKWSASITLDRDREDREFLEKLISADSFAVVVKMYGNPIEANIEELWQISFPACQVADVQRDVTTENTLPEKIEIRAARSAAGADIFTHTVVCTVTSL